MKRYKTIRIVALIGSLVIIFSTCSSKNDTDIRGREYAGQEKCMGCHKNIYDTYVNTAHHLTSSPATKEAMKGSFSPDSNVYYYRPALKVVMQKRDSSFYQVAYIDDTEKQACRFDLVFGSGRKGQSYAYWFNDYLFQLPVSYFAPAKAWVNSPNYPPQNVKFDRNIPIGCFECHSSFVRKTSSEIADNYQINHFNKNEIVYGIDCERCHGPAASHVSFHQEHPLEKKPHFIASFSTLTKQQNLDMCAMCHSGPMQTLRSTFGFVPGDTLSNYMYPGSSQVSSSDVDVHGRQYQLLTKSKCFLHSNALNCSSCHNTHQKERDNLALFSSRCMNCHSNANHNFCKMAPAPGRSIVNNCIDCHMPAKPSRLITLLSQSNKEPISALVRTHYISIYPEETKKFLAAGK